MSDASEQKIQDECAPGKPMSVFTREPYKVIIWWGLLQGGDVAGEV